MGEWSLQYQRSAVRTQSSAKFYNGHVYCLLLTDEKTKIKQKEAWNGPFYSCLNINNS